MKIQLLLNKRFIVYSFALSFLILSCSKKASKSKDQVVFETNKSYKPSNTIDWDLIHTTLHLSFDWENQYALGKAILTFTPYAYPQNKIVLDAKYFNIDSIYHSDKKAIYTYENNKITLVFPKSYNPNDTLALTIWYVAKPNEIPSNNGKAITDAKGLYFIQPSVDNPKLPRQIWTQSEPEEASCWFPTIDSPNQKSTQEMFITTENNFEVLSNGLLIDKKSTNNLTTWHYKMTQEHAPYLFMLAIGEYAVTKDNWKNIEVNYYVEPKYAPYAKNIFGNTPEMIGYFSNLLHYDYPWPKYSQVVVREFVSGAMENTSASVFYENLQVDDRYLIDDNWDEIIAHELFHHWFGDLVTCESWSNLTLNEGFATYSEYLWTNYKYGNKAALDYLYKERDEYFDEAINKKEPLIRTHYDKIDDLFDRHSYNKGGLVLHMLRKEVGDSIFFKSLSYYLKQNAYQSVEVENLRLAFEKISGRDLNWFFNQWFHKEGHPVLECSIDNKLTTDLFKININQRNDSIANKPFLYRLQLPIQYKLIGKATVDTILNCSNKNNTFTFNFKQNEIEWFSVDPNLDYLVEFNWRKPKEWYLNQIRSGSNHLLKVEGIKEIAKGEKVTYFFEHYEESKFITQAMFDKDWQVRKAAMIKCAQYYILPLDESNILPIENNAINDPHGETRSYAMYILENVDAEKYKPIFKNNLSNKSYYISSAALSGLLKTNDPEAIKLLPEYEKIEHLEAILTVANYYVQNNAEGKYAWFEEKMNYSNTQIQYNLLNLYVRYSMLNEQNKQLCLLNLNRLMEKATNPYLKEEYQKNIAILNQPVKK
jgi:aminopeptidase N